MPRLAAPATASPSRYPYGAPARVVQAGAGGRRCLIPLTTRTNPRAEAVDRVYVGRQREEPLDEDLMDARVGIHDAIFEHERLEVFVRRLKHRAKNCAACRDPAMRELRNTQARQESSQFRMREGTHPALRNYDIHLGRRDLLWNRRTGGALDEPSRRSDGRQTLIPCIQLRMAWSKGRDDVNDRRSGGSSDRDRTRDLCKKGLSFAAAYPLDDVVLDIDDQQPGTRGRLLDHWDAPATCERGMRLSPYTVSTLLSST